MADNALLLVNLGSTPSTQVADVRRFLDQFLMDPYVIDVPWPLRRLLVSLILRKRPQASAAAYESIWWDEGSPLTVVSQRLRAAVAEQWEAPVALAMRYGEPSIADGLAELAEQGTRKVTLAPLYPQFADSTVTTVVDEARRAIKRLHLELSVDVLPPFYDQPEYIQALAETARPALAQGDSHLLLSYHGLPERHIRKADPSHGHCLASGDCCQRAEGAVLAHCYRAQCVQTSRRLSTALDLAPEAWSMSFQSRLGRAKWIEPYTDATLAGLPAKGVKKLVVMCPAFVADCIETLEEIGLRGRDSFMAAGGESFTLIPCLNDQPQWVEALMALCRRTSCPTLS